MEIIIKNIYFMIHLVNEYKHWLDKYEELRFMKMVYKTAKGISPTEDNETQIQFCIGNMNDLLTQACWDLQISPTDFLKMCEA